MNSLSRQCRRQNKTLLVKPAGVIATLLLAGALSATHAAEKDLADLSLEELMNESVTSVSKKETRLGDSPAAIALLTPEDIRRSGHASLPELLRMVPGLDVARVHGNEWAISARGLTGQYANKLLVLVDGRSVYSPMFAGVYWNVQDLVLEDIDRIEVIRGPGATLWGANAVNGVINITTKSAKETQGGLVTATFGTEHRPSASIRYGGQVARDVYYRIYVSSFNRKGFVANPGAEPPDDWDMTRVGAQLDWEPAKDDRLSLQAEYYSGTTGEHFDGVSLTAPFVRPQDLVRRNSGGHVLGRWSRQFSSESQLTVQTYYDRFRHWDGDIAETRDTLDLGVQHRFAAGSRHDVVWGFDCRYTSDHLSPTFYLSFNPERQQERLYSVFLQDEITIVPDRLKLTVGSKVEHNDNTGVEVQPGGRLLWQPADGQTLWASISRAVRTPSRYDRDSRLNAAVSPTSSVPFLVSLLGKPDADAEELIAYEAGYRLEVSKRLSIDLAGYYNRYDGILAYVAGPVVFENDPAPPHLLLPLHYENLASGVTYGSEAMVQWRVTDHWKLTASHTWIHIRMQPDLTVAEEAPQHQFQLRSYLDLPHRLQLNAAIYHVGSIIVPLDNARAKLDAYLRLDLGLSWQPTESMELGLWGQNLLDPGHAEFGSFKTGTLTQVPRSITGRFTWKF